MLASSVVDYLIDGSRKPNGRNARVYLIHIELLALGDAHTNSRAIRDARQILLARYPAKFCTLQFRLVELCLLQIGSGEVGVAAVREREIGAHKLRPL